MKNSELKDKKFLDFIKNTDFNKLEHKTQFFLTEKMAEHVCSGGAEPDIIEDKVISMNKPYFIFRYISMLDTRKVSFNFDEFQQALIDANDAEWMWKFATHFKVADIELIRKHIHTAEGIQSFIEAFDRDFPICTVNN